MKIARINRDKRGITIKAIKCKKKTPLFIDVTIFIVIILLFVTSSGCAILGTKTSTTEPQIKIINPENKQTVSWPEEIGGTAKNIPDNQKVWILAYSKEKRQYYPLAEVEPKDGEWITTVNIGLKKDYNEKYDIIAVLADKKAQDKFNSHLSNITTEENEEDEENIQSQIMYDIQEGTKEYDRITVTREDTRSSLERIIE